jgi:phage/plasmid-associated DNA primase
LSDKQIRTIIKLVVILPFEYYDDRNKWRDVIYSLANTSETLKDVAIEFSKKSEKFDDQEFEKLWEDAVNNTDKENKITYRSLYHWANQASPQEFKIIIRQSCSQTVRKIINEFTGRFGHTHIASILYELFKERFINNKTIWWQYITNPSDTYAWKWRQEQLEPNELYFAMNQGPLVEQIDDGIAVINAIVETQPEDSIKYFEKIRKNLEESKKNITLTPFRKNCVIEVSRFFYSREVSDKMDADGNLIGCHQGILKVDKKMKNIEFINYQNEFFVSKMIPCRYRQFVPSEPTEKEQIVLRWFEDVVFEKDARNKILFYLSTGIVGGAKASIMLLWEGSGTNGKSSILNLWNNTLGKDYATKLDVGILTFKRTDANAPKSAVYAIKGKRAGWFDETDRTDQLTASMLKTLANSGGQISVAEKYKTQETIPIQATFIHLSNYSFVIKEKDTGTWRRIMFYRSKVKFCLNPNPQNEYEKLEDKRYSDEYINDPEIHEAFFSILVYYYEHLIRLFDGNIKLVPSPTIDEETRTFRKSQDKISKFITENMIYNESAKTLSISELVGKYTNWLEVQFKTSQRNDNCQETQKDFENSILRIYISELPNGNKVVEKCRILEDKDRSLIPGDFLIGLDGRPIINNDSFRQDPDYRTGMPSGKGESWWIFNQI